MLLKEHASVLKDLISKTFANIETLKAQKAAALADPMKFITQLKVTKLYMMSFFDVNQFICFFL